MLGTQLFGLPNVSQTGLEPVVVMAAAVAAHLFSQCNVAWRSFPWTRGSGYQSLILLGPLFPTSVVPKSQHGFGVMELMLSGSAP
jgi:hypothetical protein